MHRLPVAAHRVAATNLIAMLAALPAAAQRGAPRPLGNPIHVAPTALARVAPDGQLTSPWHVLGEGGTARTVCNALLCFDAFEPDGNVPGFPNECYPGFDCGMGSHRWWFGTAYTLGTFAANDMQSGCVDCWGAVAQRLEFAWHWGPCPDHGGVSRCLVGVWTTENWADCQAPAYAGSTYSGVLYDFGTLECNANGYYFADIYDLCDLGLYHPLPLDGAGGYLIVLSQGTSNGYIVLAEGGQTMLWGPKRVDTQGPKQYQDDNPRDAMHNFLDAALGGECYDYAFGVCPDPLGACAAFYSDVGRSMCSPVCAREECCPCDTNCDGSVNGFDIEAFLSMLTCGGCPCSHFAGDMNGDGSLNGFDVDPFLNRLLGHGDMSFCAYALCP
ncbi:MAG: hypothetical protein CHACPFDD_01200 [Phycisphaerae bacterium]|nr:hypothetical protein [Phycisphaerae bacterium]